MSEKCERKYRDVVRRGRSELTLVVSYNVK
jgi:hypothetical protein